MKTPMQTPVSWLLEQIEKKNGKEFVSYFTEFIQQAKEMERGQIEGAYKQGCKDTYGVDDPNPDDPNDDKEAYDYFTQTYEQ